MFMSQVEVMVTSLDHRSGSYLKIMKKFVKSLIYLVIIERVN